MTLFELVKLALDELYQEGKEEYGLELDAKIKAKISYLGKSYGNLTKADRESISYSDPATRFAYVYMYSATHGDYVVQAMEQLRDVNGGAVFKNETARVSCVGGGPGSDIMGVIKYLSENSDEPVEKLTCYLLDGEQAWADTWTEVGDAISSDVHINVNFQPLDVTNQKSWTSQKKFLKAELFTFIYFVSEVKSFDADGIISAFWTVMFDESEIGTKFIYIDNGNKEFNDYFDSFWKHRGDIKKLVGKDNWWISPRYSEQSGELSEYKTKFEKHSKTKSMITTRILKKTK